MTYCGAEISYGRGNCAFPFVMSSWHHMEEKKKNTPVCYVTSFFFFYPVTLFFSCLEKQTRAHRYCQSTACLCADPELLLFFFFSQNSLEYANEGASHSIVEWVMWPEQRGLRARRVGGGEGAEAPVPQTRRGGGEISTCPHLLWERVALCIMETHRWIFFFLSSHELKHGNTTLTHLPAS